MLKTSIPWASLAGKSSTNNGRTLSKLKVWVLAHSHVPGVERQASCGLS